MAIDTPLRLGSDPQTSDLIADDHSLKTRRRTLEDGPNIMTWVIQPGVDHPDLHQAFSRVEGTFQHSKDSEYESIQEYLSERAGWVDPLMEDFTQLSQSNGRPDRKQKTDVGRPVTEEFCVIGGVPIGIKVFRRDWPADADHAWVGRDIRRYAKAVRLAGQGAPHLVVWFHPSYHMANEELPSWLERCEEAIEGFVDERMEASDLQWEDVSTWLKVIHTPWATFATLTKPFAHYNRKYEARVRHLVVDPVILATAQHSTVQAFVGRVSALNSTASARSEGSCREARDEFYRWRSAYWWAQPAKATIPNRVWRGAVEANNTASQVEALSQEMSDYAAVEDVRHNQRVERHNRGLAWGGIVFAVLAILLPFVYSESGIGKTVLVGIGALAAFGAAFGVWSAFRRFRFKRR